MSYGVLSSEELLLDQYLHILDGVKKKLQELQYYSDSYDISLPRIHSVHEGITYLQKDIHDQIVIIQEKERDEQ